MRPLVVLVSISLLGCSMLAGRETGETHAAPGVVVHEIHGRPVGKVDVSFAGDTMYIDAQSPSGIGGARLVLTSGAWPTKVVVRLKYSADKAFALLEGPGAALETTVTRADEPRIILTAQRLKTGGFEFSVPATEMKVLHVHWVDAFRH